MSDAATLIDPADLARALAWAERSYRACDVCALGCGVDRTTEAGARAAACGLGEAGRVYKEYLHWGEERRLVPSHTVYLSGCNFRCGFCSDWEPVAEPSAHGVTLSPRALALRIAQRRGEGARNVNFVGGLPDVNVLYLLRVLEHVPADTHVVWNTNLWTTEVAIDHLAPLVGTWLVDLKFGDDACAKKLARVGAMPGANAAAPSDYLDTMMRLLGHLTRRVPAGRAVLVRHLLMPGHFACCTRPALERLAATHPGIAVNLMTGYLPYRLGRGSGPLARRMPGAEVDEAIAWFASLPFADVCVDGVEWSRAAPGSAGAASTGPASTGPLGIAKDSP